MTSAFNIWSQRVTWTLLHFSWQAALLGLLLAVVSASWLRRQSIHCQYGCYVASLFIVACLAPLNWWLLGARSFASTDSPRSATTGSLDSSPNLDRSPGENAARSAPTGATTNSLRRSPMAGPRVSNADGRATASLTIRGMAPYLTLAYMAGAMLMWLRLARGAVRIRYLCNDAKPIDADLQATLVSMSRRMGVASCACRTTDKISIPIVVGWVRPMILVPLTLSTGMTPAQIELLLAHELAHLHRGDPALCGIQRFIEASLFFHPVIWFIGRQIDVLREQAADARVVEANGRSVEYADALLAMAEKALQRREPTKPSAALAADGRNPSELRRRILRLLGQPEAPAPLQWALAVASGIILLATVATAMMPQPPTPSPPTAPPRKPPQSSAPAALKVPDLSVPKGKPFVPRPNDKFNQLDDIDLSSLPSNSDRHALKDLFQVDDKLIGGYAVHPHVFIARIGRAKKYNPYESWVYFIPTQNQFYIRHRRKESDPASEAYFGPILGDPFEKLHLTARFHLLADMDPLRAVTVAEDMLRTGDDKLAVRALDLLERTLPPLTPKDPAESVPTHRRMHLLEVVELLGRYDGLLARTQLSDRSRELRTRAAQGLAANKITVSKSSSQDYQRPTAAMAQQTATIAKAAWGEPIRGLRAAMLMDPMDDKEPWLRVKQVIQNVSDQEIRFTRLWIAHPNMMEPPTLVGPDGRQIHTFETLMVFFAGLPQSIHVALRPGESFVLPEPIQLQLIRKDANGKPTQNIQRRTNKMALVDPGPHLAGRTIRLGEVRWQSQPDGTVQRSSPGLGEWIGELEAGVQVVNLFPELLD